MTTGDHVYYSINIGGLSLPLITDTVCSMFAVTAVIVIFVILATRKLKQKPTGLQGVAEVLVEFINKLTKEHAGSYYKKIAPYICSILLFIGLSNLIGLFVFIEPPTKNINVTLCLAMFTIVFVIYREFKFQGVKDWLKSFYKPNIIFGFVKILDYILRPVSLCLRLFGNIVGGVIAMNLIYLAVPIVVPVIVSMYFDLFDGILQAYIFVFLSTIYLAGTFEKEVS